MGSLLAQRSAVRCPAMRSPLYRGGLEHTTLPEHHLLLAQRAFGNQAVQRSLGSRPTGGAYVPMGSAEKNSHQKMAALTPLHDNAQEETGHTDCDWDKTADPDIFVPKSGNPISKIEVKDECIKPCTTEHENTHKKQVGPICKTYYDCYTSAAKEAAKCGSDKECKLTARNKQLGCFVTAVEPFQDTKKWECEAYKVSLACAQKLQQKADNKCSGKLGAYIYSVQQNLKQYCEPEKEAPPTEKKPAAPEKTKSSTPSSPDAGVRDAGATEGK
jgi:hypothetical protein